MASKSKKRRRVLGASCILAALIIAGSSFAWFTSKDEVTNRLAANADYGVRIVESFAPTANWLPGQTVNKDVYATNTGTVAAFVKETVSGVLTITNEKAVTGAYNPANEYVELTEEERYAVEAGAFLAYKPDGDTNELGNQLVVRPDDNTGTDKVFDFTPTVEGLYVFRRTIDVNNDTTSEVTGQGATTGESIHTADDYGAEVFTYDAYYFVPGKKETTAGAGDAVAAKFLKVSNLFVTEDVVPDIAGDGIQTDGYVTSATYGFYQETKDIAKNVDLTYKELGADATIGIVAGKYLVATYDTGEALGVDLDAEMKLAAKTADAARHEYELALEAYESAAAESATADNTLETNRADLADKKTALINAMNDLADKQEALAVATAAYDKLVKEESDLNTELDALKTRAYGGADKDAGSATSTSVYGRSNADLTSYEYSSAHTQLSTELTAAGLSLSSTYDELKNFTPSPETHEYFQKLLDKKQAQEEYGDTTKGLLGRITAINTRLTALATEKTNANSAKVDANSAVSTATNTLNTRQTEYNAAFTTFNSSLAAAGTKSTNLDTATERLATARTKYFDAINAFNNMSAAAYESDILKIYIKLSDSVVVDGNVTANNQWQMLPTTIYKAQQADFYYTGMLQGGATSNKLIDSVTLDARTTKDMYKVFDFDVNVALDSVQVTQDENGRYQETPANEQFGHKTTVSDGAKASIETPASNASVVAWTFDAKET